MKIFDVFKKKTNEEKPKKTKAREWFDSIVFAVIAATIIRWLFMEAFVIPTPSMEGSLLVGDYLFVSKVHYGTRTPQTPLQIPLAHQKIWGTNIPSYLDWVKLPQYRLPGFSSVKRNDVVVFNVPPAHLNENINYPIDLKTFYVKRCVAVPGDEIKIEDRQIFINGEKGENPENMQFAYYVYAQDILNQRVLNKLKIYDAQIGQIGDSYVHYVNISPKQVEELKALPVVTKVTPANQEKGQYSDGVFPNNPRLFPWNNDWFGPLKVPQKGETVQVNEENLALYGEIIHTYDHNKDVKIENNKLFIDGQELNEYTFKQNYYFMMGDNRNNSLDSRYWGFVPEDHVLGKAAFTWFSIDANESFGSKIRWSKIFSLIK
jgi:signal peptidase I